MKQVSPAAPSKILFLLVFTIVLNPALTSQPSKPQATANGKRIFNQLCAVCHNTLSTTTKSGPGLQNYNRRQSRPNDATLRTIIQRGKGKMPAFTTLNKTQVDDLVDYLKTL